MIIPSKSFHKTVDSDKEYIGEHTSVTKDEVMKYENFLQEHPDGQITPQDFR